MFQGITLDEAMKRVADPAEWEEFCALPGPDMIQCWIISYRDSSAPLNLDERNALRSRELWQKFADEIRHKLISGDWIADGFNPQFGARAVQIDTKLWRVLEFTAAEDRVDGGGYKFVNLSFSEARPSTATLGQVERKHLRTELIRWIEAQGRAATGPMTAEEVRSAARRAFEGTRITDNLFREAWAVAEKPEHFRQRGRPKTKVQDF